MNEKWILLANPHHDEKGRFAKKAGAFVKKFAKKFVARRKEFVKKQFVAKKREKPPKLTARKIGGAIVESWASAGEARANRRRKAIKKVFGKLKKKNEH